MYSQVSFAKGIPLNFHLKKHIDYLKCHNRLMININQLLSLQDYSPLFKHDLIVSKQGLGLRFRS